MPPEKGFVAMLVPVALDCAEAIRLENSWHRPELPEVVTLSLPLTVTVASPNDHAHELSKFVGSMFESGHGSQGKDGALSKLQTQLAL